MARFFASRVQVEKVNNQLLSWLEWLPDSFFVFVNVEGADFHCDVLILKDYGIFNIATCDRSVRAAEANSDWMLNDGSQLTNPFIQLLDQNQKVADYLIVQREDIFDAEKAKKVWNYRNHLRVFPVVAVTDSSPSLAVSVHPWRKVFSEREKLDKHLRTFSWFPNFSKVYNLTGAEILKIAELFRLAETTSSAIRNGIAPQPLLGKRPSNTAAPAINDNPYQYTFTVTGDNFYGRQIELQRIHHGLKTTPAAPIAIIGLQRAGKSSLARESIRRLTEGIAVYRVIEFDFRRLQSEPRGAEQDITFDFIRELATGGQEPDTSLSTFAKTAENASHADQHRLFIEALKSRRARRKRTILFLDECQEVESFLKEERYRRFFVFIDALCRDPDLGLNIILASRPSFFELKDIKDINLGRLFNPITLGPLEREPALSVINRGKHILQFDTEAKERILLITSGHAFWLQFLCHRIHETALITGKHDVDADMVDAVFESILQDPGCKSQFYLLYQEIGGDSVEMNVLKALAAAADTAEPIPVSSLRLDGGTGQNVGKALRILDQNQIIRIGNMPHQPTVAFRVEALRQWMRQNLVTL